MIFIGDLKEVSPDKYTVGFKHFMPFDEENGFHKTQEELLQTGKLVALPIELPPVEGKNVVMYYALSTNSCFYEYEDIPVPPKTEIELLQEANIELKTKLETSERVSTETSVMLQELVEILIEMEVI